MRPPKYEQRKNIKRHLIEFVNPKGPDEPPCICSDLDCLPVFTLKSSVSMHYHHEKLHTKIKQT